MDNRTMSKTDRTLRTQRDAEQKAWDAHAYHPLQSWAWGEFRKQMGIDVARTHTGTITFHKIPHTPWTVGYFPKGPKPTSRMVETLREIGKTKRAIFIQLEPDLTMNTKVTLSEYGLVPAHHPLFTKYTFMLDLTKSEDELLKAMHAKTRYNLKVAARHGVSVQEDNSDAAFTAYLTLSEETTARQGFYAHNKTYHEVMWKVMRRYDIAHLFTATLDGHILAAWIIFAWKDTIYYPYGASGRDHREVMAPTIMLWEIAKWGKANGYKKFDLWGAMGPNPDTNDPWYGFHRFKQGFNPTLVEYVGSYDLVILPMLYRFYTLADTLRWVWLKLRRH